MAEILYHFVFRKPKQLLWLFLKLFLNPYSLVIGILTTLKIMYQSFEWSMFGYGLLSITVIYSTVVLLITLNEKAKGTDVPEEEFILYDNGWFVFWGVEVNEGRIAPAKLDWVLPPAKPMKELEKEIGYDPNWWYCLMCDRYILVKKRKRGKYKVWFSIHWTYPNGRWDNWVFFGQVGGLLNEEEFKKLQEFADFISEKAKENIKSGRVRIPARNLKQEHIGYYQRSWFWNKVFKKENIRELYRKETGEDIPEPVRSFLFDYPKFKSVYLKNKRETGDWFGRKGDVK